MTGSRILRLLLLSVNLLLITSLLLSNLARFIDPNIILFPAFFGLAFLPLLFLNLLFALFWLVMRPKYLWFAGAAVIISLPVAMLHIQLHTSFQDDSADFKILSYNVRLFDLYNWSHNKKTRNKILDYVQECDADIICLQEYFRTENLNYFNTLDTLLEVQRAKYYHEEFTGMLHGDRDKFGIITISVFPIISEGRVPLDTSGHNIAIYTDIKIKDDTIRVFNLHLASVHLSALEKDIDSHIKQNLREQQWEDLKQLIQKLAGGFKRRANQANVIAKHVKNSPHPVIICGDFNDTPGSYAYQKLSNSLKDSFVERGIALGSTYIGFFPSFRIDYLLHDERLDIHHFQTENVKLSDHRPLVGQFSLTD
ncbi:MAG: endonuclease/exonuclease/phosphatase family protein [Flavobacteriales bacterium]